jgi:transcriptional regulator with XRE-family HTH domain
VVNTFLLKEFGTRIKNLRIQKGWSQGELADKTGFHRTYIGMIERGERNISLTHMAVFAKVFELNISNLLDFREINPNHNFELYEFKSEGL